MFKSMIWDITKSTTLVLTMALMNTTVLYLLHSLITGSFQPYEPFYLLVGTMFVVPFYLVYMEYKSDGLRGENEKDRLVSELKNMQSDLRSDSGNHR